MRRLTGSLLALSLLAAAPLAAWAGLHFSVRKSAPVADEALNESPKALQIWFSQVPAEGVSQLTLATVVGDEKKPIAVGKTAIDKENRSMTAELKAPLSPGAYLLQWKGAGDDGHVMTGEVKFSVVPKSGR